MGFAFERRLPIIPWTEIVYFSTYFCVIAAPFLVPTSRALRRLTVQAWIAMILIFPIYLTIPTETPRRLLPMDSWMSPLLAWERSMDPASLAFPSFHTTWAFLIAAALPGRFRWLWRVWAACIGVSCVTTGMHSIADVIAGWLLAEALLRYERVWAEIVAFWERIPKFPGPVWAALGVLAGVLAAGATCARGGWLASMAIGVCIADGVARLGTRDQRVRLYLTGCNVLGGLLLLRLWKLDAPVALIAGAALILRAATDFAWIPARRGYCIAVALGGVLLTCIPGLWLAA